MNTDCKLPEWIIYPERQIIGAIITEALARGYAVSIHDGEEWALIRSTHRPTIEAEIGATDCTTLRFAKPGLDETGKARKSAGSVFLVHGNGSEVIADYTDNAELEAILKPASDLAETYSAAGV